MKQFKSVSLLLWNVVSELLPDRKGWCWIKSKKTQPSYLAGRQHFWNGGLLLYSWFLWSQRDLWGAVFHREFRIVCVNVGNQRQSDFANKLQCPASSEVLHDRANLARRNRNIAPRYIPLWKVFISGYFSFFYFFFCFAYIYQGLWNFTLPG